MVRRCSSATSFATFRCMLIPLSVSPRALTALDTEPRFSRKLKAIRDQFERNFRGGWAARRGERWRALASSAQARGQDAGHFAGTLLGGEGGGVEVGSHAGLQDGAAHSGLRPATGTLSG